MVVWKSHETVLMSEQHHVHIWLHRIEFIQTFCDRERIPSPEELTQNLSPQLEKLMPCQKLKIYSGVIDGVI